jgi:hypothetical protein
VSNAITNPLARTHLSSTWRLQQMDSTESDSKKDKALAIIEMGTMKVAIGKKSFAWAVR